LPIGASPDAGRSEESYLFDPEIHQLKPGCSRPQDFKDKIFYSYDIVRIKNLDF